MIMKTVAYEIRANDKELTCSCRNEKGALSENGAVTRIAKIFSGISKHNVTRVEFRFLIAPKIVHNTCKLVFGCNKFTRHVMTRR